MNRNRIWLVTIAAVLLLILPVRWVITHFPAYSPRVKLVAFSAALVLIMVAVLLLFYNKSKGKQG